MKSYANFPPINYFIRVLKNCPASALLYLQLWDQKNQDGLFAVSKRHIRKNFLKSPTLFRNHLTPLMFMGLLKFSEDEDKVYIDLFNRENGE